MARRFEAEKDPLIAFKSLVVLTRKVARLTRRLEPKKDPFVSRENIAEVLAVTRLLALLCKASLVSGLRVAIVHVQTS